MSAHDAPDASVDVPPGDPSPFRSSALDVHRQVPTPLPASLPFRRHLMDVIQLIPPQATIRPWVDPVVDARGHDPRSIYVERYWLSVIGPDGDVDHAPVRRMLRRRARGVRARSRTHRIDDGAVVLEGRRVTVRQGAPPLRDVRPRAADGRRVLPCDAGCRSVAQRHLKRLPDDLQAEHDEWARRTLQWTPATSNADSSKPASRPSPRSEPPSSPPGPPDAGIYTDACDLYSTDGQASHRPRRSRARCSTSCARDGDDA